MSTLDINFSVIGYRILDIKNGEVYREVSRILYIKLTLILINRSCTTQVGRYVHRDLNLPPCLVRFVCHPKTGNASTSSCLVGGTEEIKGVGINTDINKSQEGTVRQFTGQVAIGSLQLC